MADIDLDQLLADAMRVLDDEGVESFMDEGPDLLADLAEAVRELRAEAARLTRDLVDLNAAHASVCDEVVQLRAERDASSAEEREACARRMDRLSKAAAGRRKDACVLGVEASLAYRHGAEEIRARGGDRG